MRRRLAGFIMPDVATGSSSAQLGDAPGGGNKLARPPGSPNRKPKTRNWRNWREKQARQLAHRAGWNLHDGTGDTAGYERLRAEVLPPAEHERVEADGEPRVTPERFVSRGPHLLVGSGPQPLLIARELVERLEAVPGYFPNLRDPTRELRTAADPATGEAAPLLRAGALLRGSQCYGDRHMRELNVRTLITLYKPTKRAKQPSSDGSASTDSRHTLERQEGFHHSGTFRIPIAHVLPQELQLDTEGEPELALLSSPGRGGRSASCVTLKQQIHVNLIPTGTSLHIMRKFPWWNILYVILFGWWAVQGGAEQAVFTSFPSARMRICSSLSAIVIGAGVGVAVGLCINLISGGDLNTGLGVAVSIVIFIVISVAVAALTWYSLEKYGAKKWEGWETLYITIVDYSQAEVAQALRVFAEEDNYPVLVHCIHGKDRTGIIVALVLHLALTDNAVDETLVTQSAWVPQIMRSLRKVLTLCWSTGGAAAETAAAAQPEEIDPAFAALIVDDYALTEMLMLRAKARDELRRISLNGRKDYMIGDHVLGSPRAAMVETLAHIRRRYGSVRNYAAKIGLGDAEVAAIRRNMRRPGAGRLLEAIASERAEIAEEGETVGGSGGGSREKSAAIVA